MKDLTSTSISGAISLAGVVAVYAIATSIFTSSRVSDETSFIDNTVSNIRATLINYPDASYVTTANVATDSYVPNNRISGANITSPWGNITFAAANVTGAANDGFSIAYPLVNMPARYCKALAVNEASRANIVVINATTVKSASVALSETAIDTACGTTGSLTFSYSRLGT